jgi:hypothetical protein
MMRGNNELSILQMKIFIADMALIGVGILSVLLLASTFRIVKRRTGLSRAMKNAGAGLAVT